MLIAAAAEGPESPEVTSQRGMDAPRDQPNEEQSVEPDEAKSFDFDALFTPAVPAEELESETSNDDEEAPKRASVLSKISLNNNDGEPGAVRVTLLGVVVAAVLIFVGTQANQHAPPDEAVVAFHDLPGFPTTASRSLPELAERIEPVLFDLKANNCTSNPVALAIDRERLIAPSSSVNPGQKITIKFAGEKITGQVVGATRSPDLALIVLDERLDIDPIDIPPLAGPLELGAPKSAVYVDGKFRWANANGPKQGWAGPDQGMILKPDIAHGSFTFLPSGRFVGMVSKRPDGRSIVQARAAISDSLARIVRGAGDDFGCLESTEAGNRRTYGDPSWGLDQQSRPADRVLEPFADRCVAKDWSSCDRLRNVAVFGSEYIVVARTCGGTIPTDSIAQGCSPNFGILGNRDSAEPFVGACLVLPRAQRERAVITDCFDPHDAEVVAVADAADGCMPATRKTNTSLYWDRGLVAGAVNTPNNDVVGCFLYDPGYVLTEALPEV